MQSRLFGSQISQFDRHCAWSGWQSPRVQTPHSPPQLDPSAAGTQVNVSLCWTQTAQSETQRSLLGTHWPPSPAIQGAGGAIGDGLAGEGVGVAGCAVLIALSRIGHAQAALADTAIAAAAGDPLAHRGAAQGGGSQARHGLATPSHISSLTSQSPFSQAAQPVLQRSPSCRFWQSSVSGRWDGRGQGIPWRARVLAAPRVARNPAIAPPPRRRTALRRERARVRVRSSKRRPSLSGPPRKGGEGRISNRR